MASKSAQKVSIVAIPQFNGLIKGARYDVSPVGRKLHMADRLLVSSHLLYGLLVWQFKQLDGEIVRPTCKSLFVSFYSIFVQFHSYLLFAFSFSNNMFFLRVEAAPLEDVLCRKGHSVDPVTVTFHAPQEISIAIINTYLLIL